MLQTLVEWSIRHRWVVLVLSILLFGTGIYATKTATLDVFPEFAPPQVIIQTEAPGLSTQEVEQLVTLPIEAAVNGVPKLETLRSQSIQGLSVITIFFQDQADLYRCRQLVAERLSELSGKLPDGVKAPRLAPLTSTTGRLLTVGFTSTKLSAQQLRERVQWNIRPRILAVGGVAQVTLYGGESRQIQVQIIPEALAARQLTVSDVIEATRQATGIRGAGFIENGSQRLTLQVEAQTRTAKELEDAVITSIDGTPIRLKDVAYVVDGAEPKFGDAQIMGQPGVELIAYKQVDGDTVRVTKALEAELAKLEPSLNADGITLHRALFRQADLIELAVGNVTTSLLIGAALVAVVLFIFLFNFRTAFISLVAIPLSLLGAILILRWLGISLNTLTLGGLAIAVGEVVDDAIIDVENIYHRLRDNAQLAEPRSTMAVVLAASLEVRSAVVYATFIVAAVFLPILSLTGLQGRLFSPLAYAYILAVMVSLLVALTVTPALSMLMLTGKGQSKEPFLLRWLQSAYVAILRVLDRNFILVMLLTIVLLVASLWAASQFGGEFLPELKEHHYVIHMRGVPGTSVTQSLESGKKLTELLLKEKGVRSVCQQVGRAELGEDTWGVEYSELEVDLNPTHAGEAKRIERFILETVRDRAGFTFETLPFLTERIKETLSGQTASVAIKITGDDFTTLDATAQDIAKLLNQIPGHAAVRAEVQTGNPTLVIRVRSHDAARFGLKNNQVLEAVHVAFQGLAVTQVYDRNRVYDVVVNLDPGSRQDVEAVSELWLAEPGKANVSDSANRLKADTKTIGDPTPIRVQLKQVADIFIADTRFLIAHEGGLRRQVVYCNVQGRDVESFATEVQQKLRLLSIPNDVTVTITGEHEARRQTQRELLLSSLVASVFIVMLLGMAMGTWRRLLLVLINLPFALMGGIAAVYVTGGILNVGSMVGFVTLFGITVRNGMMMISHWQHLHDVELVPWGDQLIYQGARDRLAPVLMTALVTALGLLPIAIGGNEPGREIEGPMAMVILGGLASSTLLNLCVLPMLYRRYSQ